MRKKYVIIGITCILLLISGICYSCSYKKDNTKDAELITNLSGDNQRVTTQEITYNTREGTASELASGNAPENTITPGYHEEPTQNDHVNEESSKVIYIHMCGQVIKPGVYEVSEGARVIDLIELAGGLSKEAAGDYINQALKVSDGQRIYIPSKEESKELPVMTDILSEEVIQQDQASSEKKININLADAKELMELPGVGEAKAASIIEYRSANGGFHSIEELMKIPGIKEGLFNKVSSNITVR